MSRNCLSRACNCLRLCKHTKKIHLFCAKAPLTYIAIKIPDDIMETFHRSKYQLVIMDQFSKLEKTVPLGSIAAESLSKSFVTLWVMSYGSLSWLLSDNGPQFTWRFFQHVRRILGVENLFTKTYHSQCNGQAEQFIRTILSGQRNCVADNSKNWDLFFDVQAYAYDTQVHETTKRAPFYLALSRLPTPPTLDPADWIRMRIRVVSTFKKGGSG